jgi:hypothetical protein
MTFQDLRMSIIPCAMLPLRGGWHMSYFGGIEFIKSKLNSFSHQEYNNPSFNSEENIKRALLQGQDLFGRGTEENLEYIELDKNQNLPPYFKLLVS